MQSLLLAAALVLGSCTLGCAAPGDTPTTEPGQCTGDPDDDESCFADDANESSLRWRGFPYHVSNPAFAKRIYGGEYVRYAFFHRGFEGPDDGEDWDVLWTHRSQGNTLTQTDLPARPGMRLVNHCQHFHIAGDKCTFSRYTNQLRKVAEQGDYGHRYFLSFELGKPNQLEDWRQEVQQNPKKYWLLKPCDGGASKGIQLFRGPEALKQASKLADDFTVAQEYLSRPFMGFGGRKFHLRLYILVTRWDPVAAYLSDGGLVFRSLRPYAPPKGKRPGEHDIFSSISEDVEAVPLTELWSHLDSRAKEPANPSSGQTDSALPASTVQARIHTMLHEVLSRYTSTHDTESRYGCFDLFGADVILDPHLRPMLMEINVGPNLWIDDKGEASRDVLKNIKGPMIDQVVQWLALRIQRSRLGQELTEEEAAAMEAKALLDFTRVI